MKTINIKTKLRPIRFGFLMGPNDGKRIAPEYAHRMLASGKKECNMLTTLIISMLYVWAGIRSNGHFMMKRIGIHVS